ncbi:hypothetical protein TCSYLVIO_010809 [Trypanosoma cruzi]|nr:hypothetical protein TCSYLVIO_010809 [Trypanosoma cruzi]
MAGIVQPRQPAPSEMKRRRPHAPIRWHRSSKNSHTRSGLYMSARDASQRISITKVLLQSTAQIPICPCAGGAEGKKKGTERHISTARGTAGWRRYMRHGPNIDNHARWQHIHIHKKQILKTRRQGVAVCVALRVSARPGRKEKQRERNVCSAPQTLVARPHVTAPSARRSSRPLLMRAAGEAHRVVVMSVSVGVRVEQLGGKHTAPLAGRVQKKH